jgi:hypothetical protein
MSSATGRREREGYAVTHWHVVQEARMRSPDQSVPPTVSVLPLMRLPVVLNRVKVNAWEKNLSSSAAMQRET